MFKLSTFMHFSLFLTVICTCKVTIETPVCSFYIRSVKITAWTLDGPKENYSIRLNSCWKTWLFIKSLSWFMGKRSILTHFLSEDSSFFQCVVWRFTIALEEKKKEVLFSRRIFGLGSSSPTVYMPHTARRTIQISYHLAFSANYCLVTVLITGP